MEHCFGLDLAKRCSRRPGLGVITMRPKSRADVHVGMISRPFLLVLDAQCIAEHPSEHPSSTKIQEGEVDQELDQC